MHAHGQLQKAYRTRMHIHRSSHPLTSFHRHPTCYSLCCCISNSIVFSSSISTVSTVSTISVCIHAAPPSICRASDPKSSATTSPTYCYPSCQHMFPVWHYHTPMHRTVLPVPNFGTGTRPHPSFLKSCPTACLQCAGSLLLVRTVAQSSRLADLMLRGRQSQSWLNS